MSEVVRNSNSPTPRIPQWRCQLPLARASRRVRHEALQALARAGQLGRHEEVHVGSCETSKAALAVQDKKYGRTRRELLHEEYVEGSKRGGIGQPKDGFEVAYSPQLFAQHSARVSHTLVLTPAVCCQPLYTNMHRLLSSP